MRPEIIIVIDAHAGETAQAPEPGLQFGQTRIDSACALQSEARQIELVGPFLLLDLPTPAKMGNVSSYGPGGDWTVETGPRLGQMRSVGAVPVGCRGALGSVSGAWTRNAPIRSRIERRTGSGLAIRQWRCFAVPMRSRLCSELSLSPNSTTD